MKFSTDEYNPYYQRYIDNAVMSDSIFKDLEENGKRVEVFYNSIADDKWNYSYAEGKWTVKDILLHLIDTERVFAYRAMRIARQDKTEMAGFDQDDYVVSAKATTRSSASLLAEYAAVRQSTVALFKTFTDKDLKAIGKASGSHISVRAIGCVITGHENHHNNVIKNLYL